MKKNIMLLVSGILLWNLSVLAQTNNCGYLFNLKPGVLLKNVTYNEKMEVILKTISKIMINDGQIVTLSTESYQSGAPVATGTVLSDVLCKNGEVCFPIDLSLPSGTTMKYAENTDKFVSYPAEMQPGMKLNDVECSISGSTQEGYPFKVKYVFKERTVEGVESITTPAGTFECTKINYLYAVGPVKWQTSAWLSKDVGIVKTEYYKKGKLVSSAILEQIVK
jgi:hypothetical protein